MASRAPTGIDDTYDVDDIEVGKDVIFTEPDIILDNQEWIVDRDAMVFSEVWYPVEVDSGAWTFVRYFQARGVDRCTDLSTEAEGVAKSYILGWAENGTTDFDLRVAEETWTGLGSGGTNSVSVTSSQTSKIWRDATGTMILQAEKSDKISYWTVDARRTAGSGKVWVAGLVLFMD